MEQKERDNLTKLLEIDPIWLLDYLTNMAVENAGELEEAIENKDRDSVYGIISCTFC